LAGIATSARTDGSSPNDHVVQCAHYDAPEGDQSSPVSGTAESVGLIN
jgi:hypothetical protein